VNHLDMLIQIRLATERGSARLAQKWPLSEMLRANMLHEQVLVAKGSVTLFTLKRTETFMHCPPMLRTVVSGALMRQMNQRGKKSIDVKESNHPPKMESIHTFRTS
jgi:hypothetical protein